MLNSSESVGYDHIPEQLVHMAHAELASPVCVPECTRLEFIISTASGAVSDDGASSNWMTFSFQFELYAYSPSWGAVRIS